MKVRSLLWEIILQNTFYGFGTGALLGAAYAAIAVAIDSIATASPSTQLNLLPMLGGLLYIILIAATIGFFVGAILGPTAGAINGIVTGILTIPDILSELVPSVLVLSHNHEGDRCTHDHCLEPFNWTGISTLSFSFWKHKFACLLGVERIYTCPDCRVCGLLVNRAYR